MSDDTRKAWSNHWFPETRAPGGGLWPAENLVRMVRGRYIPGYDPASLQRGGQALDIGFGSGANLVFLASLGLTVSGVEIEATICTGVRDRLAAHGIEADLRVGTNQAIPFADESFDILVAWDVVHYAEDEEALFRTLAEYRRVLKPKGRFFIQTTGPENSILKDSLYLGNHRFQIGRADDFRRGSVFFYFNTKFDVEFYFRKYFADINVGNVSSDLFTQKDDSFVVTGVRASD